jgi:TRAP-type C4-dicarboxylate transport system permease small subunit
MTIWKALEWLSRKTAFISGLMALVITFAIFREVIGRYFFNHPSDWSLELSGYLLVGLTYMGASYTELKEHNIRIDFLYMRFRGRLKHFADLLISLIGFCWSGMLVWQGLNLALHSFHIHARSSEAMAWPLFPSQIIIPIGAALLCLTFVGKFCQSLYSFILNKEL